MSILSTYLEDEFQRNGSNSHLYFILDQEAKLIEINELLDYRFGLDLFGRNVLVKLFTTKKLDDYYKIFEKKIRNIQSDQIYLVVFSNDTLRKVNIPYIDFFKTRGSYIDFNFDNFVKSQFKLSLSSDLLDDYNVNWFIDRSIEILAYRTNHQEVSSTDLLVIDNNRIDEFLNFCVKFREKNILINRIEKPLFIVDMSLFEFIQVLLEIQKIKVKSQNKLISERELRSLLRAFIIDMFGEIPMDFEKNPRNITNLKTKEKMAGNYLITFSQLNLLDNLEKAESLCNLYNSNKKKFFYTLKNLLLNEGNWKYYLEAIKSTTQATITSKTEYYEYLTVFMYNTYHKFYPELKKERWRKQLRYIQNWLISPKLNICQLNNQIPYKLEILDEQKREGGKIFKHIYLKDKQYWKRE